MTDLTPEAQAALVHIARKIGRTGISKITRSQLQSVMGIPNYYRDLKPHIEDLEDEGLIEVNANGSFTVLDDGKALAWETERYLKNKTSSHVLGRARVDICDGESLTSLLSSSAPPPGSLPSSVASESSRSVKSSPRSGDRFLYSEDGDEEDGQGSPHWISGGRIDRKTKVQNPTASGLALATWFQAEVDEVLADHGQGRIRAVRPKPLAKHLNEWKRDYGIPFAVAKDMMQVFLDNPERWLREKNIPAWQVFLKMKDELLTRVKDLGDDDSWSDWAAMMLTEEEK